MHRLRVIHNFLWYLIYGHPRKNDSQSSESATASTADQQTADTTLGNLDVSSSGDEEEEVKSIPGHSEPDMKGKQAAKCSFRGGSPRLTTLILFHL